MEVSNPNQKIEQLRTEFRPRNRESCKDTLELVDNDVDKARALLKAIGPPLHSIQSQDSSSTSRTYGATHGQVEANGAARTGQTAVLNLNTME